MIFGSVITWCCQFVYKVCPLSENKSYFNSIYKTLCFFQSVICGDVTVAEIDTEVQGHTSRKSSTGCENIHYLEYFFKNFTNIFCNISLSSLEIRKSEKKNYNQSSMMDFFRFFFNSVSEKVTSSEMLLLPIEGRCYLNWCVVSDYVGDWWRNIYKKFYEPISNPQPPLFIKPETNIILNESGNWLLYIDKYVKTNPRTIFFAGATTAGIIFMIVWYLCPKFKKHADEPRLITFNGEDANKLMKYMQSIDSNTQKAVKNLQDSLYSTTEEIQGTFGTITDEIIKDNKQLQSNIAELQEEYALIKSTLNRELENVKSVLEPLTNDEQKLKYEKERYDSSTAVQAVPKKFMDKVAQSNQTMHSESAQLQQKYAELKNQTGFLNQELKSIKKMVESLTSQQQNRLENIESQMKLSRHLRETELEKLHQDAAERIKEIKGMQRLLEDFQNEVKLKKEPVDRDKLPEDVELIEYPENDNDIVKCEDPYVINCLKKIEEISQKTQELITKIQNFTGNKESKIFLDLKERLIQNALKLDAIESDGHSVIRIERKNVLKQIHISLETLESKAN